MNQQTSTAQKSPTNWLTSLLAKKKLGPAVRPYDEAVHGGILRQWLQAWQIAIPDSELRLPPTGRVVGNDAIGFLVQTDAGQAYLDRFITRPDLSAPERAQALDTLTAALEECAPAGVVISALSQYPGLDQCFSNRGYGPLGTYTLFIKAKK